MVRSGLRLGPLLSPPLARRSAQHLVAALHHEINAGPVPTSAADAQAKCMPDAQFNLFPGLHQSGDEEQESRHN